MTKENVKKGVLVYIDKKEKTNYAIMISGEWGAGKTHLLQNEIMPAISEISLPNSDIKYRPIYVSLSGVNTTERLTELMYASINLKPQKIETQLEFELAQFENQRSKEDYKPKSLIQKHIVFCFDDLERIYPSFLEELFAYVNTYIEHSGNKVLFIADEYRIKEANSKKLVSNYEKIREKYIRRTYRLDANFELILNDRVLVEKTQENEKIKVLIAEVFRDGLCNNLRTLQFMIETLEEVLREFNKITIDEEYQSKLLELIVFYTAFVSIEYKKGYKYGVIKDINFPNTIPADEWIINLDETMFSGEKDIPEISEEEKERIEKRRKEIEGIQKMYFPPKDETQKFFNKYVYPERAHFNSIGKYIDSGELNSDELKKEIEKIKADLRRQKGTEDDQIRQKISSIYDVSDADAKNIIIDVIGSIKDTSYSKLSTYLSLFSDLLVLEYHKIHDFKLDKKKSEIFVKSIEKGVSDKTLKIEPFLNEQTIGYWTDKTTLQSKKFHRFRECILKVNENLISDTDTESSLDSIIKSIGGTDKDLQKYVVESKDSYTLKATDAIPIFEQLINTIIPRSIDKFIMALDRRYVLEMGYTQASYERGFINKMFELVDKYLNSIDDRPLSYIPLYNLKKKIEHWIKYYSLNREENEQ